MDKASLASDSTIFLQILCRGGTSSVLVGLRAERQHSPPGLLLDFFSSLDYLSCLCKQVVFLTVLLLREDMAFYQLAICDDRFLNFSTIYNLLFHLFTSPLSTILLFVLAELWSADKILIV